MHKHRKARRIRVVFTNGCFDLLRSGHVDCLIQARALGDKLIVGLNSDSSVRRLKGPQRPLFCQDDRAFLLRALRCVDEVVIFEDDTPEDLIRSLRPDVLVKGSDWEGKEIAGAEFVKSCGGQVVFIPRPVDGPSTGSLQCRIGRIYGRDN